MPEEDPQLEAFLRQFKPRPPAPLPRRRSNATRAWWGLAAAASISAALLTFWPWRDEPASAKATVVRDAPPRPTLGDLNAALRRGNYEEVLEEMDARILPDPTRPGGALRELGALDWGH